MNRNWRIAIILIIIVSVLSSCNKQGQVKEEIVEEESQSRIKYGFPIDEYRVVIDTVRSNETLSDILGRYNVSSAIVHRLVERSENIFNVRNIRADKQYSLLFCSDDSTAMPQYMIYEKSLSEYAVIDFSDSITVSLEQHPKENHTDVYGNTINKSLWHSFVENGETPALAMEMASVYQWAIDFYNIKKGDSYKIAYTQDYVEGKPIGNIKPIASSFTHQDSTYYAFWFQKGETKGYFDENGASLHKAFLKAPLKFTRISSKFSGSRLHPVLKYRRAHRGVDYAAPTGTPVRSVGNGTVIKKAYQRGGAGNYVKIKHNKTFTTVYMHFVRHVKSLKVGQRVSQGDVIGYVGMTGSATGPHLHYGVIKNGKYINPLSMKLPPSKPLKGELLERFMETRDSLLYLIDKKPSDLQSPN
ncbi:murein DD-endopeptidase MepM/ murein hydrolase activator NlpD [Balneicella halophila]|uniref:Murein DD-endopeptidase MepM/ murein hydrolase activator NlpD n=1 Tax=Balneicella halophila TaxID=1537566 RepID=A0A7L4URG5_BALHA|nr:peptidoglycan DD-metalloendopeptidase family protein [Balneicella halophila]PVX51827.1 murein DD-endopeptidase MepM/ murein hydrolase activator NlpD [Balneicella halophila]